MWIHDSIMYKISKSKEKNIELIGSGRFLSCGV